MAPTLGLVAGEGGTPGVVAREARQAGWRVVALLLGEASGTAELAALVDRAVACRPGEVGRLLEVLAEEAVRHVVLAGRIRKGLLFQGDLALDGAARALLEESRDWTDDALLGTAARALEGLGIELCDQRRFLGPLLAPPGLLAGPAPPAAVERDVARGVAVARDLARHGIGQTVVVRAGTVVAVEGLEGTDETLRRGLRLAGAGAVVVKAPRPGHDFRFDVPAVGPATLAECRSGRAAALGVEAGRVLVLDLEAVAAAAAEAGISLIGFDGEPRPR